MAQKWTGLKKLDFPNCFVSNWFSIVFCTQEKAFCLLVTANDMCKETHKVDPNWPEKLLCLLKKGCSSQNRYFSWESFRFYQWETDIKVFEEANKQNCWLENPFSVSTFHLKVGGFEDFLESFAKIATLIFFWQNATNNVFFLVLFIEAVKASTVGVYTSVWLSKEQMFPLHACFQQKSL